MPRSRPLLPRPTSRRGGRSCRPRSSSAPAPARWADVAALADALAAAGEATVFLPDGRPVAWREALLHRLVAHQKIDARGGGYWTDAGGNDDRATAAALRALAAALGE